MGPDLGWSDEKPCHRVRGDDRNHTAETLPVAGGKIVAAGSLAATSRALGNDECVAAETSADKVIIAGLIDGTYTRTGARWIPVARWSPGCVGCWPERQARRQTA